MEDDKDSDRWEGQQGMILRERVAHPCSVHLH